MISHFTVEAKFIALTTSCKDVEWLRDLLLDIELCPQPKPLISLSCDSSKVTMSRALNKVYNGKSRHIFLRHEYLRQILRDGIVTILFVRTYRNLAYMLTKPLSRDIVNSISSGMRLKLFI